MTPYDTALRVQRREVDDMRVSISAEAERLGKIEQAQSHIDARVLQERLLETPHWLPSDAWHAHMRAERERLRQAADQSDARLTSLRSQAMEAYGTMRAIEGAAERYQDEASRAAAGAEQSMIDDLGAAKFVRALRDARKRES